MTQHTLSLGPLSLLATQTGPLLTIAIHAPSDTAPVGKMTLTVPEWTALVALVDSLAVADRRHAEDRAALEAMRERSEYHEMLRTILSACDDSTRASIGRDAPLRAVRKVIAERDSLRQQVRELTEENKRLKRAGDNPAGRIADLEWDRSQLRSDLSAALASVDAMAERLRTLQPIVSVLGDWDWAAIDADVEEIGTAHLVDDRALMSAVKALAHTAREQLLDHAKKDGGK